MTTPGGLGAYALVLVAALGAGAGLGAAVGPLAPAGAATSSTVHAPDHGGAPR